MSDQNENNETRLNKIIDAYSHTRKIITQPTHKIITMNYIAELISQKNLDSKDMSKLRNYVNKMKREDIPSKIKNIYETAMDKLTNFYLKKENKPKLQNTAAA